MVDGDHAEDWNHGGRQQTVDAAAPRSVPLQPQSSRGDGGHGNPPGAESPPSPGRHDAEGQGRHNLDDHPALKLPAWFKKRNEQRQGIRGIDGEASAPRRRGHVNPWVRINAVAEELVFGDTGLHVRVTVMQPGMTAAFDDTGSSGGSEDSGHHEGDP